MLSQNGRVRAYLSTGRNVNDRVFIVADAVERDSEALSAVALLQRLFADDKILQEPTSELSALI